MVVCCWGCSSSQIIDLTNMCQLCVKSLLPNVIFSFKGVQFHSAVKISIEKVQK